MTQLHTKVLHKQAKTLLKRREASPKKLVLFHTVLAMGLPLLVSVVNILLEQEIAKTSGLGGIATRSMLGTIQTLLETSVMILLPFWEIGLLFAALSWRKDQDAGKAHLTEGFRRYVNLFALRFWSGVLYLAAGMATVFTTSFLFSFTPWAQPLVDSIYPTGEMVTPEQIPTTLTPEQIQKMTPLLILFFVLYAALCIFLFYQLRFADCILLDEGVGGRQAMLQSFRLTWGSGWQIFKLDLHFWWFYLLQGLALVLCYGDTILTLVGVTLPISRDLSFLLFYAAGLLLEGLLFWRCQDQRLTTYALAYDTLRAAKQRAPEI